MWGLALFACVVACGRVGFDSMGDAGPTADAAAPTRGPWAQVVANGFSTCAIQDSGEAWCWGLDVNLQLGVGGTPQIFHPPAKLAGMWKTIALGPSSSCGIQLDGSLWCWGDDRFSQIPDGVDLDSSTPVRIGSGVGWVEVSIGLRHGCARDQANTVWCWGDNGYREYDASIPSSSVLRIARTNVRSLAVGDLHTHTIDLDGTMWLSGLIQLGEGGTGSYAFMNSGFAQVGTASDWAEVAGSVYRTCASKLDGTLWCFGYGDGGGNGDGMFSTSASPVQVSGGTNWTHGSIGLDHTCAMRSDETAWCWGATTRGQIGAQTTDLGTPVSLGAVRSVAVGDYHTCIVTTGGVVRCTGSNVYGQIVLPPGSALVPTAAGGMWTVIVARDDSTCAIDVAHSLSCWGDNDTNALGYGNRRWAQVPGMVGGIGWTSVAVGGSFSVGIRTGALYWWGMDTANGGSQPTPGPLLATFTNFTAVAAGREHACALRGNGDLYCWGLNTSGQVGNGNVTNQIAPVLIGTGYTTIAAGATHTCAVQGTVLQCWGNNVSGQVGNNATANATLPATVMCAGCAGKTVRKLALGNDFSCANMTDDSLYCWGSNSEAQFGNGTTVSSLVGVLGGGSWRTIAAGDLHMCGVSGPGELACWGHGDRGQIGDGLLNLRLSPLPIGTATDWSSVALGNHLSCALKTSGARYCWGSNIGGVYGDGKSWIEDFVTITPEQ